MSAAARWGDDTAPVSAPPALRFGPYRVVSRLGEGGMGVVYLALDPRGRAVAVKVLRPHIAYDQAARARLEREVDTLSLVHSHRVAAVVDADLVGEPPYVVTRYVGGPALDDVVTDEGALRGPDLVRLGRGLVDALDAIHDAGVIHRDLKPGNVLLEDGEPVLIDFGIAHVADDVRLTSTGLVMGTPGYLSPEIIGGSEVSEATDWWGWAATMSFAATGRPPFGRGRMEVVLSRVSSGRPDLEGLDPRIGSLLAAALSPDPLRRPPALEVVGAMEQVALRGEVVAVPPPRSTAATVRLLGVPPRPPAHPAGAVGTAPVGWVPYVAGAAAGVGAGAGSWPGSTSALPVDPGSRATQGAVPQQPHLGDPPGSADLDDPDSDWQAAWESSAEEPDPRIGRPMRSGTILALGAALTVAAATWPSVTLLLCVALCWAARFSDRSVTSLVLRRYQHGHRRSDVPMAVVASPWQLFVSGVATVGGLLLPLAVAVSGTFCATLVLSTATGSDPAMGPTLSAGFAVGALVAWWGPGGDALRRGTRSIVRGAVPPGLPTTAVVVALAAVALALVGVALAHHGVPSWGPLQGVLPSSLTSAGPR